MRNHLDEIECCTGLGRRSPSDGEPASIPNVAESSHQARGRQEVPNRHIVCENRTGSPYIASMIYLELAIVVVLILVNGLLALAELAVVSSRRARLQAMGERGVIGSHRALI